MTTLKQSGQCSHLTRSRTRHEAARDWTRARDKLRQIDLRWHISVTRALAAFWPTASISASFS
jgi:hypothetical protein